MISPVFLSALIAATLALSHTAPAVSITDKAENASNAVSASDYLTEVVNNVRTNSSNGEWYQNSMLGATCLES
jgi:conjugal transfer/entry exclusion protein